MKCPLSNACYSIRNNILSLNYIWALYEGFHIIRKLNDNFIFHNVNILSLPTLLWIFG